uniref:HMG box domain-containing protein n=1 Tax=Amphora coffeiformis TaxID=265554 RepID=A0A7S3P9J4_9STRA|mmetsp:Transcript_22360/g.42451  ORF Transcript_22360/g.42451 Transcript_22360/m.42451 type:complete len:278 (+) Transcript_22360:105-938(+)
MEQVREELKVTAASVTKHAEKPSRPLTAYNLFFHDEKLRLEKECPSGSKLKYTQVAKVVAARWRGLNQDEKAFYEQLAAKDKRRFALETIQWRMQQEANYDISGTTSEQPQLHPVQTKPVPPTMHPHYDFPLPASSPSSSSDALVGFLKRTPDAERKLAALFQILSKCFGITPMISSTNQNLDDLVNWLRVNPNVHQKLGWILQTHRQRQQNSNLQSHNNNDVLIQAQHSNDPQRRMATTRPITQQMGRSYYDQTLDGFNPEDVPLLEDLFGIRNPR